MYYDQETGIYNAVLPSMHHNPVHLAKATNFNPIWSLNLTRSAAPPQLRRGAGGPPSESFQRRGGHGGSSIDRDLVGGSQDSCKPDRPPSSQLAYVNAPSSSPEVMVIEPTNSRMSEWLGRETWNLLSFPAWIRILLYRGFSWNQG